MKHLKAYILLSLTLMICQSASSQDWLSYFSAGYSVESFGEMKPYNLIISDYNNHKQQTQCEVTSSLKVPDYLKGISLGFKNTKKFFSIGVDLHYHRFKDVAKGTDSSGAYYYKKILVTHNGWGMLFNLNLVPGRKFRMGPGFALNMEQYYNKLKNTDSPTYKKVPSTDQFLLSATLRFPLSFGGERFNLDIIPYYFYPFWKVNFQSFNTDVNSGYETTYTKEEMKFFAVNTGVQVCLCFAVGKK